MSFTTIIPPFTLFLLLTLLLCSAFLRWLHTPKGKDWLHSLDD